MKAAAFIINIGFGVLAVLSFWTLRWSSHPGSAIALVMISIYWIAANVALASIFFVLKALARCRSR